MSTTLNPPSVTLAYTETQGAFGIIRSYIVLTATNPNTDVTGIDFYTNGVSLSPYALTATISRANNVLTYTWDVTDYPEPTAWYVTYSIFVSTSSGYRGLQVKHITESNKDARLRPVTVWGISDTPGAYLKAFMAFPEPDIMTIYGRWEKSSDGVEWEELESAGTSGQVPYLELADLRVKYNLDGTEIEQASTDLPVYDVHKFYVLRGISQNDTVLSRYDCLQLPADFVVSGMQIRFRAVCASDEGDEVTVDGTDYRKVRLELGEARLIPVFGPKTEVLYSDLPSASAGNVLYYNKALYTYGVASKQAVMFASDAGSLVRPLSKVIDLDTTGSDTVTALIPWRNYLIAATEHSLHLITKSENGFYTKIINSSIGIPKQDGKCCVSVLNGVLFKSGDRIFQLYPNLYSGEDTVLNITDVSKPILHELLDLSSDSNSFAFSTEEAYYVFIPGSGHTTCLKYNYTLRVWTKFEYPVVLTDAYVIGVDDIRVFGTHDNCFCEFRIERDLNQYLDELPAEFPESARPLLLYGDYVNKTLGELDGSKNGSDGHTPILFVFDSGQKTDRIAYTKQFTEAKVMCVTESQRDSFPCVVQVAVDGELRVHTIQVNTDSPFWKTDSGFRTDDNADDILLSLNRNIYSDSADILNTMRQLIVRYSGKGHTVRFVLQGNSVCRFRIHSVLSRYRTLNVKQ